MTSFARYAALTACAFVALLSVSARADERLVYYPPVDTFLLHSGIVKQSFRIQVMRPALKQGESTRFPVVYVTDGNFAFDTLKGISYSLQLSERDAPRFIVVGIGYPGRSPLAGAILRGRDLTFPGYPLLNLTPPPIEGVNVTRKGEKSFYGAEEFQRFIAEELIPHIEATYRTLPGDRTYFGHSAGGGFGLFTMFTRPNLFRNYIVSSPGLTFNGESSAGVAYDNYEFLLETARKFASSGGSLPGIRLYMSVGTEEEFEPNLAQWRLTSSFDRMAKLLQEARIPGLETVTEAFPGETHMTVWPLSFIHGVQAVFGTGARRKHAAPAANANVVVVLQTTRGQIEIAVDVARAPASAEAFLKFVDDGSLTRYGAFYRTVRKHDNDHGDPTIDVVQGGWRHPPDSLPGVVHEPTTQTGLRHEEGSVSLARGAVGTATGAAFFVCIGDQPALDAGGGRNPDGQGFAVFGRVTRGMDIVREIHNLPTGRTGNDSRTAGQMLEPPVLILNAYRRRTARMHG